MRPSRPRDLPVRVGRHLEECYQSVLQSGVRGVLCGGDRRVEGGAVINAPILHVFAAVTYFTGVVAQVIADQLVPDPYYPTDSSGGGTQMDPPVVFIWEVDEHGSPAEVPTDSALYFDNDGTIHLHVEDDVDTKKYFKVATSLGAFDVMTVQHSLLSQDFEHKVVA